MSRVGPQERKKVEWEKKGAENENRADANCPTTTPKITTTIVIQPTPEVDLHSPLLVEPLAS